MNFDNLVRVFKTEGDIVEFDPTKIQASLVKETGMTEDVAKKITELVVRRIISSGFRFLSGPHIREVVCSILSEQHHNQERKLYTRIGMPLMDYEEILEKGSKNSSCGLINPEKVHHLAANQLANEYALLRILDSEESKAHLFGDIHIHALSYFDSRPMSQHWDPRLILKNGLPPSSEWTEQCKLRPAENLRSAINHLAKWIGMMCGEFSGEQGLNFISTFLAPYARGLEDKEIRKSLQSLIFEINQLELMIGKDIPIITISCCPTILEDFSNLPAIASKGKQNGSYGDYIGECSKIFQIISEIYIRGNYNGSSIINPRHLIYIEEKWLKEKRINYSNVWEEILKLRAPVLKKLTIEGFTNRNNRQISTDNYVNRGVLQNISLNLPRYAYMSKNEDKFLEILREMIVLSMNILDKKFNVIQKRLNSKSLPLCCQVVENQPVFKLSEQNLAISIVGLNEAVKFLTNNELHESPDAINKGKKILEEINNICSKMSEENNKKYVLNENNRDEIRYRFAKLDLKHYRDTAMPQSTKEGPNYTNSVNFRENIEIDLLKKINLLSELHPLILNGALERISLKEIEISKMSIENFVNELCFNSKLTYIEFIP